MKSSSPLAVTLFVGCIAVTNPVQGAERTTSSFSARYAQINREMSRYTLVKRDLQGYSSEGGTLRAYLLKGSPRKFVVHHYGESGQAIEEYYFWNKRLFFMLRTVLTYDEQFGKVKSRNEHRFYFDQGKLVRWQKDKKLVSITSVEAKDYEESTLLMTRELLQRMRS